MLVVAWMRRWSSWRRPDRLRQPFGYDSPGSLGELERGYTQMTRIGADETGVNRLSRTVIGCAMTVLNTLGVGFLEKVYENALALEMRSAGLRVERQHAIEVRYRGAVVGQYFADLLVEDTLLIELKVARAFEDVHAVQCLNYLKATGLRVGLLLNFGVPRLGIKRLINGF